MEIKIRSAKKIRIAVGNCYSPKLVAIEGTTKKETVQDIADVERYEFDVRRVAYAVSAQFDDYYYEGTMYDRPGTFFIEDPYITEGKAGNDPVKKLNVHFKNYKEGDQVPIEYSVWRYCHMNFAQILNGDISLVVTKQNYPIIQWLFQALYNDISQPFCPLNISFIQTLHKHLIGEKAMIQLPTEVANSTVGEYNAIASNSGYYEAQIKDLEAEIEAKRQILADASRSLVQAKAGNPDEPLPGQLPSIPEPEGAATLMFTPEGLEALGKVDPEVALAPDDPSNPDAPVVIEESKTKKKKPKKEKVKA